MFGKSAGKHRPCPDCAEKWLAYHVACDPKKKEITYTSYCEICKKVFVVKEEMKDEKEESLEKQSP